MTVLEMLDELEDMIGTASKLPLTGKVMVEAKEVLDIVQNIRLGLPDDVQQAKWVRDEKERILQDARDEYEKIIIEAKKQADMMVEKDVITQRSVEASAIIRRRADEYSRSMRLKTFDYMDRMLFSFRDKLNEMNTNYLGAMVEDINKHFEDMTGKLDSDMEEVHKMSEEVMHAPLPEHQIKVPIGDNADEEEPNE